MGGFSAKRTRRAAGALAVVAVSIAGAISLSGATGETAQRSQAGGAAKPTEAGGATKRAQAGRAAKRTEAGGAAKRAQARRAVTVYSSLPLQGAQRLQTVAINQGAQLALKERGGKAGARAVRFVKLDDSTARAGTWTPEATARSARRAARDSSAVGYIGEFNSGASAISMQILNPTGLMQVSPSNTAVGLTRGGPGATRGEPSKYFPSGTRTYARIIPADGVQAAAVAQLARRDGCKRAYFLHDGEIYGRGIAFLARAAAKRKGVRSAGLVQYLKRGRSARSVALRVKASGARCVVLGAVTPNNAPEMVTALVRAIPRAKIYAGDGISNPEFFIPREGGVSRGVGRHITLTVATLAPSSYPAAGRRFFTRYRKLYKVRAVDPYAIYGYEAMALILDGIAKGGPTRAGVRKAVFSTRKRKSVLGTYSIRANGDTTSRLYGAYRIRNGELIFAGAINP